MQAELAAQTEAANGSAAALKTTSHDGARESRSRSRSRERAEEKKRERWRPDHKSRPRWAALLLCHLPFRDVLSGESCAS
jgi:hypothetical protein